MIYDLGGIYDYLEDIHFPGRPKFPPWKSQPWYFWLLDQQPTEFTFDAPGHVHAGDGWCNLPIFSMDIDLDVDTQEPHPIPAVGRPTLEAAADRYWQTWDQHDPRDPEFFGRMNFKNKFFWKVLGRKFPKWASNLDGLAQSRPNDPNPSIGPYLKEAVEDYFSKWNSTSAAYRQQSDAIPARAGSAEWNPLRVHPYAIPFPPQNLTFSQLGAAMAREQYWFGPIPPTAWTRFQIFHTQAYAYSYGFGQLDPFEWDLSSWPPRRTSLRIQEGGSANPPSAISGKWGGVDPFMDFIDHQIELVA